MKKVLDFNKLKNNSKYFIILISTVIVLIIADYFIGQKQIKKIELEDNDINIDLLVINEIMTTNTGSTLDNNGQSSDWLEIYNGTNQDIDLTDYGLSDSDTGLVKWKFPKTIIKSKEYLVVYLTGKSNNTLHANFSLNKKKNETVTLKNRKGKVVDSVKTFELEKNQSMARNDEGEWIKTNDITPGFSNNKEGRNNYLKNLIIDDESLIINEFLPNNKGNFVIDGYLDEYVEVKNISDKTINLKDYYISNDINIPFKWQLPSVELKKGDIYLISRKEMNKNNDINFHIDNEKGILILSNSKNIIQSINYDNVSNGYAYINTSGSFVISSFISPGFENSYDGLKKYNNSISYPKELLINEVMNYNSEYLKQDGKYYDFIELYNNTGKTVNLSNYSITSKKDKSDIYKLPNIDLDKDEYFILYASGDENLTTKDYTHVGFKLSSEDSLYLYNKDKIIDCMFINSIPKGYSYGKGDNGQYYFSKPTPNKKNSKNYVFISYEPKFSINPGVYNEDIKLKINGNGDIYYTLDGSIPTKDSNKYKGEINLDKTTVVRAISIQDDKRVSEVLTGTYIIKENHTLPVLSISLPDSSFNSLTKNLESNQTYNAHAELYEKDSSFSVDCGIKLFGGQTRFIPKKSFALKFSAKYGVSKLKYKVFPNRDNIKYDTIVVRSGSQDSEGTMFRDELATSIMNDYGIVDVQDYKATVLYINGKYWGIYFLREKVDEDYISYHYNVSKDDTNIIRIDNVITTGSSKDYDNLISYVKNHDMSKKESYEWVSKHLDIDNYIDYLIGELYTTNNDIVNTRYFNNPNIDGGKIKMIFYDFDYAFYNVDRDYLKWLTNKKGLGEHYYNNALIINLFKNKEFENKFLERLSYNMKKVWTYDNVSKRYNELYKLIEPEISRDRKRWNRSYSDWKKECEILKNYIEKRNDYLLKNVKSFFDLSDKEMKKYFD